MNRLIKELINYLNYAPSIIMFTMMFAALTETFLFPKLTTRFCYNSPEPNRVSSQCVLCNYFFFDATVMGCTGSTALSVNITATQAFCLISQCLGQIRQSPVFLGRRRRSLNENRSEFDGKKFPSRQLNNHHDYSVLKMKLEPSSFGDLDKSHQSIDYEIDGIKQRYIIKKDIEATIIDLIDFNEEDSIQ